MWIDSNCKENEFKLGIQVDGNVKFCIQHFFEKIAAVSMETGKVHYMGKYNRKATLLVKGDNSNSILKLLRYEI